MTPFPKELQADIDAIASISVVPTILEVICRTTGMGFSAVARVTDEKWIICSVRDEIAFGLQPGGELKLETTICHEIRQSGVGVIIDHVSEDETYRHHHTPAMYGFESYISIPIIRKDGSFFGTLCAIDPHPHKLNNPETIGMFKLYADLISFHLNTIEHLVTTEQKLAEEMKLTELREQFIAVFGHDMRNPVSAVLNSAQLLLRMPTDERTRRIANIILDSSYRMKGLIENVLDFASGKMGGGIVLNVHSGENIEKVLNQVITELATVWPEKIIESEFIISEPVVFDNKRIAQLFSNLLGNALTYGQADKPIRVRALSADGEFTLSIANAGKKIPAIIMERLFQPFARGDSKQNKQGLGLGLYIASEIATAHGGKIDVSSTTEETVFTLRMPLGKG